MNYIVFYTSTPSIWIIAAVSGPIAPVIQLNSRNVQSVTVTPIGLRRTPRLEKFNMNDCVTPGFADLAADGQEFSRQLKNRAKRKRKLLYER
jgi:hypothetical protein